MWQHRRVAVSYTQENAHLTYVSCAFSFHHIEKKDLSKRLILQMRYTFRRNCSRSCETASIRFSLSFVLSWPRLSVVCRFHFKGWVSSLLLCSIEAQKVDQLAVCERGYPQSTTCPIGINPRPASASRALLRLTPCHRTYRRP